MKNLLGVAFVSLLFLALCVSVNESTFKKCHQSSFCKRNRNIRKNGRNTIFSIDPESINTNPKEKMFSAVLVRTPKPETESYQQRLLFDLKICSVNPGVIRISINEKEPGFNRQAVGGILETEQFNYQPLKALTQTTEYLLLQFGEDDSERKVVVKLYFTLSWKIEILDNDHFVVTQLNFDDLFNFETKKKDLLFENQRTKANNGKENDRLNFEERFQGNVDHQPHGPSSVALDLLFPNTEHIYGLPEHTTKLSLEDTEEGEPYRLYNVDILEYETESRMSLYGSIPVIISKPKNQNKLHGIFWFNPSETWIDISSHSSDHSDQSVQFGDNGDGNKNGDESPIAKRTHWMSETGVIDLFIMVGQENKMYQVFKMYSQLTGFPYFPPYFSMGYHQCRWSYKTQNEIIELNENFDKHDIPVDVFWMDIDHTDGKKYFTFDKKTFPDPKFLSETVAEKSRKLVAIVDPHIKRDNSWKLYKEAKSKNYFIQKYNSDQAYEGNCWPGTSSWPDFLNPRVVEWWGSRFSYDKYEGSTNSMFIWNDMNEPAIFNGPEMSIPRDTLHLNGKIENRAIHNSYGYFVTKGTFEGLIKRNKDQNERPFVLTRSFFAGSQKYSTIWTGDNTASWDQLKHTDTMLVSLNLAGAPLCGEDVGGFLKSPDEELFTRWFQTSAFHPFFRSHSHIQTIRREPWVFGDPYTSVIRKAIRNRYSLLPFYYTQFYIASAKGKPIMRPLWLIFPGDANSFDEEVENYSYMIGSSILVSPILNKQQKNKNVYLPKGYWYDFETFKKIKSKGSFFNIDAPLSKAPVFYRGGKIIPRKIRVRRSSLLMKNDPITLFVFLNEKQKSAGRVYIDDGHSYDFKKLNKYIHQKIVFKNGKLSTKTFHSDYDPILIDKIMVFGLEKGIKKVYSNKDPNIFFKYNQKDNSFAIKKPNVLIGQDWEITVEYTD
ncbi:hypothetical protein M0812_09004 [Anaeramoeba flamelloides]|uniref:Glucosidase II subunit alpha n=1 Tax=Anaeramoeba flamelloides TaxID=1746091 RepID=A0AAV7ZME9_9EUKA|nr:hypothetical protein M0812_09004 [Anaeramoeba flamelloides]